MLLKGEYGHLYETKSIADASEFVMSPNPLHVNMQSPILPGTAGSDYERYLRTDELLQLQKNAGDLLHPDEMTFQIVHQSCELLLKGTAFEAERAARLVSTGDFRKASRLLRRANEILTHPINLLHVLETITPCDYQLIRAGLGHGSGLDSPGFQALVHIGPRLGQVFFEQLESQGVEVSAVYQRHPELFDLHELAEELVEFDERIQLFRYQHLKLAHRIIGG